jgi:hypothetical protein
MLYGSLIKCYSAGAIRLSRQQSYPADETVPLDDGVPETWRPIVVEHVDGASALVNRIAYEICVNLRTLLRRQVMHGSNVTFRA